MILIETYDQGGRTASHTQTCDGVTFQATPLARLNEPPKMPIIERFVTRVEGGSMWNGRRAIEMSVPTGGWLMMCHCAEDENGRIL